MTIRERFWAEVAEAELRAALGEPRVLDVESEGEARASLGAPPPLLEGPPAGWDDG